MKKILIALMLVASTSCFAATNGKSNNQPDGNSLLTEITNTIRQAPSGTTYGVVSSSKDKIVINTPFGKTAITRKDGTYTCLGISAKLTSAKNGVYKLKTSLGNFTVNTKKGTVVKE